MLIFSFEDISVVDLAVWLVLATQATATARQPHQTRHRLRAVARWARLPLYDSNTPSRRLKRGQIVSLSTPPTSHAYDCINVFILVAILCLSNLTALYNLEVCFVPYYLYGFNAFTCTTYVNLNHSC